MTSEAWERRLGDLRVWKRAGKTAVHKPLLTLLLLARAQRGEPRAVSFREVKEPLARALRLFGLPPPRHPQPEFPFWHLQSDGFWRIRNAEALPRAKGRNRPSGRTLLERNAVGEVLPEYWAELHRSPKRIPRLAHSVLDQFWPESLHGEICRFFGLDVSASAAERPAPRDPAFRDEVLRAYERRCAVCGFDARLQDTLIGVEAAHIRFRQYGGPDVVRNGLALCSLHHKAFDWGAISVAEDLRILVSQDVTGSETVRRQLIAFAGRRLRGPQSPEAVPDRRFLRWHRRRCFREPARAAVRGA